MATWRQTAKDVGARSAEVARMASAFEHDDLKRALVLRPGRHLDGRPLSGNSAVNRPGFPGFLTVVVFLPTCSAILRWVNLVLACFKQFQRLDGGLFCSHRSPMSFPPRVCGDLATRRTGVRRFCASANVNCRTKRTFRVERGRGPRRERAVSCSGSFCKRTGRETHNRPARRRGGRKDPVGNFVMAPILRRSSPFYMSILCPPCACNGWRSSPQGSAESCWAWPFPNGSSNLIHPDGPPLSGGVPPIVRWANVSGW